MRAFARACSGCRLLRVPISKHRDRVEVASSGEVGEGMGSGVVRMRKKVAAVEAVSSGRCF